MAGIPALPDTSSASLQSSSTHPCCLSCLSRQAGESRYDEEYLMHVSTALLNGFSVIA